MSHVVELVAIAATLVTSSAHKACDFLVCARAVSQSRSEKKNPPFSRRGVLAQVVRSEVALSAEQRGEGVLVL